MSEGAFDSVYATSTLEEVFSSSRGVATRSQASLPCSFLILAREEIHQFRIKSSTPVYSPGQSKVASILTSKLQHQVGSYLDTIRCIFTVQTNKLQHYTVCHVVHTLQPLASKIERSKFNLTQQPTKRYNLTNVKVQGANQFTNPSTSCQGCYQPNTNTTPSTIAAPPVGKMIKNMHSSILKIVYSW